MLFNQAKSPDPVFHIETNKIKPNPFQPRRNFDEEALKELANSIREYGILHPLVVSKIQSQTDAGTTVEYQLISGERRLMASKLVGLERVPAIVKVDPTDKERLELAIIENIQRENLNPIETARAYAKLQDQFGMTQREVAVRLGKSREAVANAIRLLNLPSHIQDAVSQNKINESQARLLLMVSDLREQQSLFDDIMNNNLSVRELRHRIQTKKEPTVERSFTRAINNDPLIEQLEEQLREALGMPVKVQKDGAGGKLTISFYSEDELFGIIKKLLRRQEEIISSISKKQVDMPPVVANDNVKHIQQEVIKESSHVEPAHDARNESLQKSPEFSVQAPNNEHELLTQEEVLEQKKEEEMVMSPFMIMHEEDNGPEKEFTV